MSKYNDETLEEWYDLFLTEGKNITLPDFCKLHGIPRSTFGNYVKKCDKERRIKSVLDIPAEVHISDVPQEFRDGQILLAGTKKKASEDMRYYVYWDITLSIKEDKFLFLEKDDPKKVEKESAQYYLKWSDMRNFFDTLDLNRCNEDFIAFLISEGYKTLLKEKVMENIRRYGR